MVPSITSVRTPTATTIEWPGPIVPERQVHEQRRQRAERDQPVVEPTTAEDLVHADDRRTDVPEEHGRLTRPPRRAPR